MKTTDKQIYVHWGSKKFDPNLWNPARNAYSFTKPNGGLWASRKDSSFGWKQWCDRERFEDYADDNFFEFTLSDDAKIATISSTKDLSQFPRLRPKGQYDYDIYEIDFEKAMKSGVDAIELCWYGKEFKPIASGNLYQALYGWDCDSIVILNPDIIRVEEKT